MKKIKIVVLMGGISSERQVSLASGSEVIKNLDKEKYEVIPVDFNGNYDWVKEYKPDLVFIALHGKFGEDGQVQDRLDSLNVAYTGSKGSVCRRGLNKKNFDEILRTSGIEIPKTFFVQDSSHVDEDKITYPVVVKPVIGGSSIGVSIVKEKNDLKKAIEEAFLYDSEVLVQEYIKGLELTSGVIGNDNLTILPLVEICPKKDFFDYEAKYSSDLCEEIVPARISPDLTFKVQALTKRIYELIGCRGFGRIDYILRNNILYPLEINMIPGLTPNSLLPKEAMAAGINYSQLLDKIIEAAMEK